MRHQEFRRAAGADPHRLDDEAARHAEVCAECAAYLRELRAMDDTILKALRVEVAPAQGRTVTPVARVVARRAFADHRRWYALAASIVGGVIIGSLLWAGGSRAALARDAVAHMRHEAASMVATDVPADAAAVRDALAKGGVRLRSNVGLVTYVMSCRFRGHVVPHLVVQTSSGPVTVLVLRDEKVSRAMKFHEQGYAGTLEPSGPGSIAVIGGTDDQVQQAAARIDAALEWEK
jgi:hypothetical protein